MKKKEKSEFMLNELTSLLQSEGIGTTDIISQTLTKFSTLIMSIFKRSFWSLISGRYCTRGLGV